MKFTAKPLLLLVVLLAVSCKSGEPLVDSLFDYKGDFLNYHSFGLMESRGNGLQREDDMAVRNFIFKRFVSMGYTYDASQPDIWVAFKYFDQPMEIPAYNQVSLQNWLWYCKNDPLEQNYDSKKLKLPAGTLGVYLIDVQTGGTIWQTYAAVANMEKENRYLIASLGRVLDKYPVPVY